MSEGNGHVEVVDLAAILETTQPVRVLRMPRSAIREDSLTPFELALIGRTLGLAPAELVEAVREAVHGNWTTLELAYAFGWVILRRVEPALTWVEAQRYGLDMSEAEQPAPDPTRPRPARASRQPGTNGRSTSTAGPGSHHPKPVASR